MAGALTKYSFINAKLRGRISLMLTGAQLTQLARAPSLEAVLALLRGTAFAGLEEIYSSTGDLKQAELQLLKDEIALYKNIKQHVHRATLPLLDALLTRFEIDNLKNAIRIYFDRTIRGRTGETSVHYLLYDPIIHEIPIDLVMQAGGFDEIAGVCEGTPYSAIIRKYYHTVESEGSLFRLEVALDHYYYQTLLAAIEELGRKDRTVALRLMGIEIDLQNISWIIRFKKFYKLPLEAVLTSLIPGGFSLKRPLIDDLYQASNVTGVLQDFIKGTYPGLSALFSTPPTDSAARLMLIDRILEEIRTQEIERILSGYPFTIGIILAYFIMKGDELGKIRRILHAKQYGRSQERIETML